MISDERAIEIEATDWRAAGESVLTPELEDALNLLRSFKFASYLLEHATPGEDTKKLATIKSRAAQALANARWSKAGARERASEAKRRYWAGLSPEAKAKRLSLPFHKGGKGDES
jgi:hypothetical protein